MKIAIYILLGTVILLFFAVFGIERWLEARIRRAAVRETAGLTGGTLRLEIGRVRVSLLHRAVTLYDMTIGADTSKTGRCLPGVDSLGAEIDKIALRSVRFHFGGTSPYIDVGSLEINGLRVTLATDGQNPAGTTKMPAAQEICDRITQRTGDLTIGRIRLRNADVRVSNGIRNSYAAKGLSAEADRFRMADGQTVQPYFCDDIRLSADKVSARFPTTAQLFEADTFRAGLRDGGLSMRHARLIPQYGKAEYAWKTIRHTDWTQALAGSIEAGGIDFGLLWSDTLLSIDRVEVKDVEIASYKNRRIVRQERFKPMLHEMVRNAPFGLSVGRIGIANGHAVYEELSAAGEKPGRIVFDNLNGVFRGITNRPGTADAVYTLTATGRVMDAALLRVACRFPAHPSNDRFEAEGTLGPANLRIFNRILEPLAEAGVRSGHLDGLSFAITGDGREAEVEMKMRYTDLSVTMLREDAGGRKRERRLMSGLVNLMLIKSSNPDRKGLRIVRSTAVRDTSRSQFNYLWKTLLTGIKGSVGFPGAK